ncbi:amidohydrolase [Lacticigenium naphthae]|uniref:amidohydrolase n=1 Tax=Lacticigenium naphthae TaxID=515351 RepID=UPI001B7FC086|nr:amidohydrolase [Lacticigenium naphthae]
MMSPLNKLFSKIEANKEKMLLIRRHLHENPELSFQEVKTAEYIEDFYKTVPVDKLETNINNQLGIVATIEGKHPGKTIALRADFDALPIEEATGLPFTSKNPGMMHACGHDGHTAYLLILAESLAQMKDQLHGTIKFIHQPAEEVPPGGAKGMIAAGVLKGVDAIFGIHLMSTMETGNVYYREGNTQTGRARFSLTIQGKGGHGSSPHLSNDAIVAASSFVLNAQTIVSRRIDPFETAVVTIGSFDGKGQFNIIKDSITLEGDVRTLSLKTSAQVEKHLTHLAKGLEESFLLETSFSYENDYPVLYNHPAETAQVEEALTTAGISEIVAVLETDALPPSEDFAYYLQEIPGSFFYVGAKPKDKDWYPHHHPKFDIDEDSLLISAKAMGAVVLSYCGK